MAYAFSGPLMQACQEASSASLRMFTGVAKVPGRKPPPAPHRLEPSAAHTSSSHSTAGSPSSAMATLWSMVDAYLRRGKAVKPAAVAAPKAGSAAAGLVSTPRGTLAQALIDKPYLAEFIALVDDPAEVNYAALLADLSDMAYEAGGVTEDALFARHQLHWVSSSSAPLMGPPTRETWTAAQNEARRPRAPAPNAPPSQPPPLAPQSTASLSSDSLDEPAADEAAASISNAAAALTQAALFADRFEGPALASSPPHPRRHRKPPAPGSPRAETAGSPVITPSVSLVSLATLGGGDPEGGANGAGAEDGLQVPILTFVQTPSSPPSLSPRASLDQLAGTTTDNWFATALDVCDMPEGCVDGFAPSAEENSASDVPPGPEVAFPVFMQQHEADAGEPGAASAVQGRGGAEEQPMSAQAAALSASAQPPAAWFACDDPVTKIRYIVIQGSTSLEHWQINLQFEPVIFEDPALGIRVHRGVYQAALRLYDDLLPVVRQHLATSPFASLTFTGHSLGGSLSTVLMLLFVHRGVLPPDSVSPIYTFGAPAVFCGGAAHAAPSSRCASCALDCPHTRAAAAATAALCPRPRGLLQHLGLGEEHIVNVIMHRDIVPRAFVCDYTLVADLLVSWLPSLKNLAGLQGPANAHKSLYTFLGRVAVLQPDEGCSFVHAADAQHPFLPSAPGLYRMVAPAPRLRVHARHGSFDLAAPERGQSTLAPCDALSGEAWLNFSSLSDDDDAFAPTRVGMAGPIPRVVRQGADDSLGAAGIGMMGGGGVEGPMHLKHAVQQFMNNPHPLTTLTDYSAYGPNGAISRYHNPRNYTIGLLALVGKAPHQAPPSPGSGLLPSLADPACPLGGAMAGLGEGVQAAACDRDAENGVASPDALRLLRTVGPAAPAAAPGPRLSMVPQFPGLGSLLAAVAGVAPAAGRATHASQQHAPKGPHKATSGRSGDSA